MSKMVKINRIIRVVRFRNVLVDLQQEVHHNKNFFFNFCTEKHVLVDEIPNSASANNLSCS